MSPGLHNRAYKCSLNLTLDEWDYNNKKYRFPKARYATQLRYTVFHTNDANFTKEQIF